VETVSAHENVPRQFFAIWQIPLRAEEWNHGGYNTGVLIWRTAPQ